MKELSVQGEGDDNSGEKELQTLDPPSVPADNHIG